MDTIFPEAVDYSTLSREALAAALDEHLQIARRVQDQDEAYAAFTGDLTAEIERGVTQITGIRDALAVKDSLTEALSTGVPDAPAAPDATDAPQADTDEDAGDSDTGDADSGDTDSGDAGDPAADDVQAAGPPAPRDPSRLPKDEDQKNRVSITASASVGGRFQLGQELGRLELAQAMIDRNKHLGRTAKGTENVPVAVIASTIPQERRLGMDAYKNYERIMDVVEPDAIVAAGGLCAPCQPYYGLENISGAQRPVRDSLPTFGAERGCVVHIPPPTLAAAAAAIGHRTMEDDADPDRDPKNCLEVPCSPSVTVELELIWRCLLFNNVPAQTWPEHVAHYNDLAVANQARYADGNLLNLIKAGSTAVTTSVSGGAWSTISGQILAAVAGIKSRHRTRDGLMFRALFPAWVRDVMEIDEIRAAFGAPTAESFEAWARDHGVVITWYIDSATGDGQIFGAQGAGALLDFPGTVKWFLYPEGTWLYLDGFTMELGLVRDSVLNADNQFQVFAETMEGAMKIGVESLAVTTELCGSGTRSAPQQATCGDGGVLDVVVADAPPVVIDGGGDAG